MSAPGATPTGTGRRSNATFDRRTLIISATLLAVAIFGGVALIAVFSDPGKPTPAVSADGAARAPRIITRPNEGVKPENGGDRGGWEQLTLMGVVMGAVVVIAVLGLRGGGSKAKANRAAWREAGESGHDGAVPR